MQGDERAPALSAVVAFTLVADDAGGLQVIEPAAHVLGVRLQPTFALLAIARRRTPAHDRRERVDELPDRTGVVAAAMRMAPTPQQPLDRVRARLEAIITLGATAPSVACDVHPGVGLQAPGLGWQRRARRAVPVSSPGRRCGDLGACVEQHRQDPGRRRLRARGRPAGRSRCGSEGQQPRWLQARVSAPESPGWSRATRIRPSLRYSC